VRKGETPTPSGTDGLRAQMLSDAATESAQKHQRIAIPA
jgi:myo-inositol 2-dehydrogenase / D-chiro-inositol 1-dehydrogenase